jgi:hypothetical protein
MELGLEICAQTLHGMACDRPGGAQVLGRVAGPLVARFGKFLPAVPMFVEAEWVEVDLPSAAVDQYQACRQTWLDRWIVIKADFAERAFDRREIVLIDSEIEVGVIARLLADKRIDTPAPVDPGSRGVALEHAHHLKDIRSGQL